MKFIMAIFIVALHLHPFQDVSPVLDYWSSAFLTRCAVPYFFVAAGFFLYRKMSDGVVSWPLLQRYCVRILRIYLVWTVIYLPWIYYEVMGGQLTAHNLLVFLRNTLVSGSYWQLWFLNALVVAALLVALFLYWRWSFRRIFLVTCLTYCGVLMACGYHGLYVSLAPAGSMLDALMNLLEKFFVRPRDGICFGAVYVALGAYIAIRKPQHSMTGLCVGTILSWLAFAAEVYVLTQLQLIADKDAFIALLPVAYFTFLLSQRVVLPESWCYHWLRKLSTFVFLVHPVWYTFMRYLQRSLLGLELYSMLTFVGALLLSILSGVLLILSGQKVYFLRNLC